MKPTTILRAILAAALLALPFLLPSPAGSAATVEIKLLSLSAWLGQVEPRPTDRDDIGGAAVISAYWQQERTPNTLTLATGNSFGTSPPISNLFGDEPAIFAMNLMGFDADALGNDNFDQGIDKLQRLVSLAQFDFIGTNLNNLGQELPGVRDYRIFEVSGVKVAVIAVTDPTSPSRVFPGNFGAITVSDPVIAARLAHDRAAGDGAQVFVLLTEMAVTPDDDGDGGRGSLIDLAEALPEFDVVLGSTNNVSFVGDVNGVLVGASESRGAGYLRTTLTVDAASGAVLNKRSEAVVPFGSAITPDPRVEALLAPYRAQLSERLSQVVATSPVEAPLTDVCGQADSRFCESVTGNAVADMMRLALGTDFALTNSGGIRAPLTCPLLDRADDFCPAVAGAPFPITAGQVEAMLPFANTATHVQVTGAELKAMLENGVSLLPAVAGRFPQVSGFCFAYDISRPVGSRVLAVVRQSASGACDGGALDLTAGASYSLATNDFVAAGGDGYPPPAAQVVNHGSLSTLLTTYMSRNGAVIAGFQGRIQCVSSGNTPCPAGPAAPPISGAPTSPIRPPSTGDGGLR